MKLITAFLLVLLTLCQPAFAQTPRVDTALVTTTAATVAGTAINVANSKNYSVIAAVTNSAPAAGNFTCAASNICTMATHGFLTGLKVTLTTTAADLPDPLLTGTDYFVIKLSANTFSLATTLLLAQAGTAVDITDAGTGTHTITPTALAGASLKLQGSMDNSSWADLPIKATGDATKSGTITTTANFFLGETDLNVNYVRLYFTLSAGQLSISQISKVKGNAAY